MRRLPVFFVLDCSESMVGDSLQKMEDGLQAIVRALRTDPHALETVYISVIAFAGVAKTIAPLVELVSFYPPKLPLGGGTSLGVALETLMAELDSSVVKTTPDRKGDWKPIVYLFTDGRPTDNPNAAIDRWNAKYAKKATLIAVGLGQSVDFETLGRLTENAMMFEDSQEGDFKKFINWVTASVVAQSKSVGESDAQSLANIDASLMRIFKNPPSKHADEACITLVGRCQKTRKPYLMKYDRAIQNVATQDFKLQVSRFEIAGCYPLEEDYFIWSDPRAMDLKVNSEDLIGTPGCPHCGNYTAFAACGCGKLMCINGPEEAFCPWCKKLVSFSFSGNDGGFDVGRGRG
ncbi:VWA domain-containing protein [Iodobacter sp. HSC-16F04]|uniref:VWA domain-containing protein n=1 Tax=Iodobacter violaceini TaxID=3044271 RepID=A0ABX0KNS0_9NEIS|nr:TerY-C metal binding domain-containing protein [Iodobacter violacea]NHQ85134.1 VWA domain-containing protein [Iodobacter violacea]